MNLDLLRQRLSYESVFRLLTLISLLLMLLGGKIDPELALKAFFSNQPGPNSAQQRTPEREEDRPVRASIAVHEGARALVANIAGTPGTQLMPITNFREDRAMREAILAGATQWQGDAQTNQWLYRASNKLSVYFAAPAISHPLAAMQGGSASQPEGTLLTARILLGLWVSRRDDQRFSHDGGVVIRSDEILAWRGVQKHQRIAYAGAQKRFSDGYPWKQRQQVQRDLALLARYHLRGQQCIMDRGEMRSMQVDAPYLSLAPLEEQGKVVGYLVAPGNWIASYEACDTFFLASVDRQIFQLHPRNEYLALRMAFYLVEHWRQQARTGGYQQPLCMGHLLAASMIPVDKANLTSRFAPRVEAALQKLYIYGILGAPPINLSPVDTAKAHWGHDWLASSWRLVPPPEIIQVYTGRKR